MVSFTLRQPIETREPKIEVDRGLPPGIYRFSLVVTDDGGNESRQDIQTVEIRQRRQELLNPGLGRGNLGSGNLGGRNQPSP